MSKIPERPKKGLRAMKKLQLKGTSLLRSEERLERKRYVIQRPREKKYIKPKCNLKDRGESISRTLFRVSKEHLKS